MTQAVNADIHRTVDQTGRVWFDGDDVIELLLRGYDIATLLIQPSGEIKEYNAWCAKLDKTEHQIKIVGAEVEDLPRLNTWNISEPFASLAIRPLMLQRCVTAEQRLRVNLEMDLFEAHGLLPVLRLMCMLIDHFRRNKIVWGVGRGSSVASYVLFLIGVHKIDAMKYNLDISEFLRN